MALLNRGKLFAKYAGPCARVGTELVENERQKRCEAAPRAGRLAKTKIRILKEWEFIFILFHVAMRSRAKHEKVGAVASGVETPEESAGVTPGLKPRPSKTQEHDGAARARLPLSALLSQVLVAFTIEFDNEG